MLYFPSVVEIDYDGYYVYVYMYVILYRRFGKKII